jgi:hypothetical protein
LHASRRSRRRPRRSEPLARTDDRQLPVGHSAPGRPARA